MCIKLFIRSNYKLKRGIKNTSHVFTGHKEIVFILSSLSVILGNT